ncbi:tripartite tricarboxylate transporter substrate binding protein [Actibacterium sp. 188UL27-1]|uniref:Bug family tripartite tricarboxylate transporter substrate binding protein n=1 Tax=Actibacterium sp. 188UL27-1 TaxID=2786961 RepID=UPI00195D5DD7|nr:tripartite tricarboxylate transporter substrate-binding protein [Actibacterium sp. 188UL27-1]MBM7069332.1 tripartite tricarboxylate transporter substrate-binding protein [Actibacterium sp. 188UL27-1]
MKPLLKRLVAAFGVSVMATAGIAADWTPPGPVKLMIGFRAGGGADTQARLIAEDLETRLGWKIIPEQVTGKGGLTLATALAEAPADGTVIGMLVTESLGYNMAAAKTPLTPADFTALTTTASFQMGIVAPASKGWTAWDQMISAAKDGTPIRFGVMSPKLADLAYLLGQSQGVDFNIIEVKGGKAVLDGVTAGDMDVGFMAGIQTNGVAAGDLVNLASAMSRPLKQTPEAPAIADLGVPFDADGYFVFVAPKGLPDEAKTAMSEAIAQIVNDPESKAGTMIGKAFGGPAVISGDDLQTLLQDGYDAAGGLLEAASE